jgi:isopenicillin-N epimerase
MTRNRALALRGRDILLQMLRIEAPAPDAMLGSMAALPLPDGSASTAPPLYGDPLQDRLLEEAGIEVPVVPWPQPPRRLIRISAQLYNRAEEYATLAAALDRFLHATEA